MWPKERRERRAQGFCSSRHSAVPRLTCWSGSCNSAEAVTGSLVVGFGLCEKKNFIFYVALFFKVFTVIRLEALSSALLAG